MSKNSAAHQKKVEHAVLKLLKHPGLSTSNAMGFWPNFWRRMLPIKPCTKPYTGQQGDAKTKTKQQQRDEDSPQIHRTHNSHHSTPHAGLNWVVESDKVSWENFRCNWWCSSDSEWYLQGDCVEAMQDLSQLISNIYIWLSACIFDFTWQTHVCRIEFTYAKIVLKTHKFDITWQGTVYNWIYTYSIEYVFSSYSILYGWCVYVELNIHMYIQFYMTHPTM